MEATVKPEALDEVERRITRLNMEAASLQRKAQGGCACRWARGQLIVQWGLWHGMALLWDARAGPGLGYTTSANQLTPTSPAQRHQPTMPSNNLPYMLGRTGDRTAALCLADVEALLAKAREDEAELRAGIKAKEDEEGGGRDQVRGPMCPMCVHQLQQGILFALASMALQKPW